MQQRLIPVILCGGAGTRLWPASRDSYPKQFLAFGSGRSLFQDTLARVSGEGFGRPIIVSGNDYRFLVAEQARALGIDAEIVLEPARRDSCAAIAAAARVAERREAGATLLVLSADHVIPDTQAFLAHVARGVAAAAAGRIVTFGIRPTFAATGYGYLQPGDALAGAPGVNALTTFREKPDATTAAHYLADGYLWNSGNFLFRADAFLAELARLQPDIHDPAVRSVDAARGDLDFLRLDEAAFTSAKAMSVDYAVMEKTALSAVVPSDFVWSDVGSWGSIADLATPDADGNAAHGDGWFEDARNCYVYSPDTLTAVVGLTDVVVVATRDAILVTDRKTSESVKTIVGKIAKSGRREASQHLRCYRPWGHYEQIDRGERYQVKRITVAPGAKLSLQSHFHRSEHWVVVSGTARVIVDDAVHLIGENQSVYIPLGARHRLENPGQIGLELIEVQSGSYLGEDDIIRYEDDYNRS